VFIVFDGLPVPFFIESFTKRGNTKALVHLTDIDSMEDVEEITGKAVYVDDSQIPEMTLEEDGFAALVGWILLTPEIPDQVGDDPSLPALTGNLYEVGEITDFIDIPNNPCIEVETENGAVMIPLHEDFILSVDPENMEIIMQIPAGLL
jgi:16S rRNA processing protein RimM